MVNYFINFKEINVKLNFNIILKLILFKISSKSIIKY